jgi:benzodiazapine receptor
VRLSDIPKLAAAVIICQLAGWGGSFFTLPAIPTWYQSLHKPSFTPPNGIFSPVWISLYLLMGVSLYFVWQRQGHPRRKIALILFFLQLILNILWSALFFGLRSTLLGLIAIVFLWVAILFTIQNFLRVSKIGGLLLLPYFGWVSFAALLNLSLWNLNL